jgi:hypothetical protein
VREIQTERLRIRTLKHDDLPAVSLLMGNAAVMRYLKSDNNWIGTILM